MPENRLLVLGAGGHGRVVASVARAAGWIVIGYADRDPAKIGRVVDAASAACVMTEAELLESLGKTSVTGWDAVALGIGANRSRWEAWGRLAQVVAPPIVHPRALLAGDVVLPRGTIVMAGAIVNTGAVIGGAVILNTGCIVEHDVVIADGAHLSPGAVLAGGVKVGPRAWIGANAVVKENVAIGADAIVGAGSVVVKDVPDAVCVMGNPARPAPAIRG